MALIPVCLLSVMALGLHSCYPHWVTRTVAISICGCYPQWPSSLYGCYLCLDYYLYWDVYTVATPIRSCYPQWPFGLCGCYPRCGCYLCRFLAARPSSFLFALSLRSPFALRAIGRRVIWVFPLICNRTSRFLLYAYARLFSDGFCPPGRLHGCSVSPAFGAGSSASARGVDFVVPLEGFV